MDREFEGRYEELMDECKVSPALFEETERRLRHFVGPFACCLGTSLRQELAQVYVAGLVSDLEYKNIEKRLREQIDGVQDLREHGIEPEEAEECFFFHDFDYCKDERRFDDVYILDGRTDRGRRLRLVFQDKGDRLARIFTGWELKPGKRGKK